jgi:signal transduction histidine kinase
MPNEIAPRRPRPAARRLLLIFAATILVPGVSLGILGLRRLTQERRDAERQVRERLDAVAENMGRRMELELKDWQQVAADLARSGSTDPALWPERVRTAVSRPGAGVVLLGSRERAQALPVGQLLFELSATSEDVRPSEKAALFDEAESLEVRSKQYDRAIALYRQLLASRESGERARVLHLLARTLNKAGRVDEAVQTFHLLEQEPPIRIVSLPSDLLALFAIASLEGEPKRANDALRLYQGLVAGRWRLDRVFYEFYSMQARDWIPQNAETARLIAEEHKKLALSLAAERFVASPRSLAVDNGIATLAFSHPEPFAAILVTLPAILEGLLPGTDRSDLQFTLLSPDGQTLAGEPAVEGQSLGTYMVQNAALPIRLQFRPKDPASLYAGVNRQQNLYLAMLAVLVALLAFGGYFTVRTLRTEIAIAQMKSDFVSTVSHEFRSPLAGINQLGEMLRDGRVPDEGRRQEYYGMIVAETQRLRRLVENVLDFARMEDGRKQYRFEPVEPAGWLMEVADDFRAQMAGRGFAIEARIPSELPVIVGDRETLTTAVHNLLDNAVKYSGNSKAVRLEASADSEGLSISVCDRGVGIREEDRPRLFEKFYRGGGEVARQVKGVGLGLNLVHHIVVAHGGTIDVDSREGEGSTFTIHLKSARRSA